MDRNYWVETSPSGRPRFVKNPRLRRSNTHDGSQSSRGRRVDFVDVTRGEYNNLRQAYEDLAHENGNYKTKWRSCDDEVQRLREEVRNLEHENGQLRSRLEEGGKHAGGHHESRHRENEMRKLRYKNTRLQNENDSLRARIGRLERGLRDGVSNQARRLADEVVAWKRWCEKLDDEADRLCHKLDSVQRQNRRLIGVNESLAKQGRTLRQDVDYYQSLLRRNGTTEW